MEQHLIQLREDGHVVLTLRPIAVWLLPRLLRQVIAALEGRARFPRPGARRIRHIRQRMFPDAYPNKTDSEAFRNRHEATMRSAVAAATRRVLASCHGAATIELDRTALADWFTALGAARWLYLDRTGTVNTERPPRPDDATIAAGLQHMHDQLAQALEPESPTAIQGGS